MPKRKLSDAFLRKVRCPDGKEREDHHDTEQPGLMCRVTNKGTKSWAVLGYVREKRTRVTLGEYPTLSLSAAREKAAEVRRQMREGINPNIVAKRERARAKVNTLKAAVDAFIKGYAKPRLRTAAEVERILTKDCLPVLGEQTPLHDITRADVRIMIREKAETTPIAANRMLAHFRKFCGWAVSEDLIAANPCEGIKAPAAENSRDRVLDDDEIRKLWAAWAKEGPLWGGFFHLSLLLAQRREETIGMRWSELAIDDNEEGGLWSIPRERAKTDKANEVPLTKAAVEILLALPRFRDNRGRDVDFVFPSGTKNTALSGFSKTKARCDKRAGISDYRLHDLRRTAASGMAALNVAPHIVEKILNHSTGELGGVAGVYNRYAYIEEKRHALKLWAAQVERILTAKPAGNVVRLADVK